MDASTTSQTERDDRKSCKTFAEKNKDKLLQRLMPQSNLENDDFYSFAPI